MSFTPLTFTGVSKYSTDFQSIVDRAVSIASLPVTAMTNQQTDIVQEKVLATNLQTAVAALGDSVTALGKLGASQALSATSSDSTKVTATVSGTATPAYYAITEITSLARTASETSTAAFASTDTVDTSFTLTVGTTSTPIALGTGENTLSGLRDAINAAGAGVTATILTTSDGNYLSVSANSAGSTTLTLTDSASTDFLTSANQGADTVFKLNGVSVTKSSTTVNDLISGVILNFAGTTSTTDLTDTVGITLAADSSKIASALNTLVSTYNEVATEVSAQIGSSAGLLSGNNIIRQVRSAMMSLTQYSGGSGDVSYLSDLGIELSSAGVMSFDSDKLSSLSSSQLTAAFSFLGTETTGLGAVAKDFTQLSDSVSGTIKVQLDMFDTSTKRISDQIDTLNDRISAMQEGLATKLQLADALLASLESQQSLLTASITSLNYTSYGTNTSTTSA